MVPRVERAILLAQYTTPYVVFNGYGPEGGHRYLIFAECLCTDPSHDWHRGEWCLSYGSLHQPGYRCHWCVSGWMPTLEDYPDTY